ncbi:MAG: metallophosphoesterase [Lachnospiraceae bacterium]|nr:metallophosphoesterase [Lachnospiraceae bacterium]
MIYAISDIHGCLKELKDRMESVDLSGDDRIFFLGDYIDYGPESCQVLRYIYDLQQKYGKDKVVVLKGNHEAMLLEWIDDFNQNITAQLEALAYDSWLKTDSEHRYNAFRTFVTEEQLDKIYQIERISSFAGLNVEAVKMVLATNGDLIKWIRSMDNYFETESQIFVHAGVDEEAEEYWEWGTGDDVFLWKFPASTGKFIKTIIAGHVGTGSLAHDRSYHEIYYDGESHYYIDGSVYKHGRLLLLGYDETDGKYYQIEKHGRFEIKEYGKLE